MNVDENTLAGFLNGTLSGKDHRKAEQLIQTDPDWRKAYDTLLQEMNRFEQDLQSRTTQWDTPDFYWNNFLPRLHDRIESAHRFKAWKRWSFFLTPAMGTVALIILFYTGFFPKNGTPTVNDTFWIESIEPEETLNQILSQKQISKDDIFNYLSISLDDYVENTQSTYSTDDIQNDLDMIEPEDMIQEFPEPLQKKLIDELKKTDVI
jgi:hypothetical protein